MFEAKPRCDLKLEGISRILHWPLALGTCLRWQIFINMVCLTQSFPHSIWWKASGIEMCWDPVPLPSMLLMAGTAVGKAGFPSDQKQSTCPVLQGRWMSTASCSCQAEQDGRVAEGWNGEQAVQRQTFTTFVELTWSPVSGFLGFHLARLKTQADRNCTNDQKGIGSEIPFVLLCLQVGFPVELWEPPP